MDTAKDSAPSLTAFCLQNKWTILLSLLITICVYTRIKTGRQYTHRLRQNDHSQPRPVPMLPYWLPWIGHSLNYVAGMQEYFVKASKSYRGGIFALRIAGGTHNVIVSPSLAREIYNRRGIPVESESFVYYAVKMFFGDGGEVEKVCERPEGYEAVWGGAHRAVAALMRDPFLGAGISRTSKAASEQVWNLVSGSASWVDQAPWERAAGVQILPGSQKKGEWVAEANAYILVRNWISSVASPLVVGKLCMENNPSLVEDIWLFNGKMEMFMAGLPRGVMPSMTAAYAARDRFFKAMLELHQAMYDVLDGKQPEARYHDVSDVPQFMWDRVKAMRSAGASIECTASGNMSMAWALNVNANQVTWWMLFYIYQRPDLLAQIRKEIAPFVKIQKSDPAQFSILEAPRLNIDVQALWTECPLLKGAFLETARLEVANASFKKVMEDFTITESLDDALVAGKSEPDAWLMKKGDFIVTTNFVHQSSDTYFKDPEKFDAKRFWVKSQDQPQEKADTLIASTPTAAGKKANTNTHPDISVEYGQMNIWGGGKNVCKGRNFSEREIMIFASSIIFCWEMEPADPRKDMNRDGSWRHPGRKMGAGSTTPVRELRVKIRRRKEVA